MAMPPITVRLSLLVGGQGGEPHRKEEVARKRERNKREQKRKPWGREAVTAMMCHSCHRRSLRKCQRERGREREA